MRTCVLGALISVGLWVTAVQGCPLDCAYQSCTVRGPYNATTITSCTEADRFDVKKLTFQPTSNLQKLPKTVLKLFPEVTIIIASNMSITSLDEFEDNGSNMLETLVLEHNQISAVIDTPFCQLNQLHYLSLAHNKMTELACENLAGIHNLDALDLSHNQLSTFTCHFMYVTSLKVLILNNNHLKTLVFTVWVTRLEHLYLQNNQLTTLDYYSKDSRKKFRYLKVLDFSNNPLINHAIVEKPQLECLSMDGVGMTDAPPQNLKNLKALSLANNQINSFQWLKAADFPMLQYLKLTSNNLSHADFTDFNKKMPQLRQMGIGNNNLDAAQILNLKNGKIVELTDKIDITIHCPKRLTPKLELNHQTVITVEEGYFLVLVVFSLLLCVVIMILTCLLNRRYYVTQPTTNDGVKQQDNNLKKKSIFESKDSFDVIDEEIKPDFVTDIADMQDIYEGVEPNEENYETV